MSDSANEIAIELIEEAYSYMKHTPVIKSPLLPLYINTTGNKKVCYMDTHTVVYVCFGF